MYLDLHVTGSSVSILDVEALDPLFWRPTRIGVDSAWSGHIPFAFWLVTASRPRVLVELGTHNGVSYSAFCDAVLRNALATSCFAIDTWEGDPHAGGYSEDVFVDFSKFHQVHYAGFSELVRGTFDQALEYFADGSVDLLHIDGYHTYDAVRNDFENWLPKCSDRAVVLFHDTNVRTRNFGVWKLFAELSQTYPHFEFMHGHGLGLLAVGPHPPSAIAELCGLTEGRSIAVIRERFALLGERWSTELQARSLETYAARLQDAVTGFKAERETNHADIERLTNERNEARSEAARNALELDQTRAALARTAASVDELMRERVEDQAARAQVSQELTEAKTACDQAITERDRLRAERDHLARRLAIAERRIGDVFLSTSWRLTAPLRWVKRMGCG